MTGTRSRPSLKLKKCLVLLEEARRDLEVGCYNKAVSAAYFAVRMAAEVLLKGVKTRRDDKVANALGRVLGQEYRDAMLWLYEERKRADYRAFLFNRERAALAVRRAEEILSEVLERIRRERG